MTLFSFFHEHPKAAIALSGGVDSVYLYYAAHQCGADVKAYFVESQFQPGFERQDVRHLELTKGLTAEIIPADILSDNIVVSNSIDRCYHCKRTIFKNIIQRAHADGYDLILDGTNASDDAEDRPGMKALRELGVRSPLRECGLTKNDIRRLSKEAGLFTWDKPSYACLATRIPTGETITAEKLRVTEQAEAFLHSLGFRDFRVRMTGNAAKIQVNVNQMELIMEKRSQILERLGQLYSAVTLDLEARDE